MAEFNFIDRIQTREPFFFHVKRPYNVLEVIIDNTIANAKPVDIVAGYPLNMATPPAAGQLTTVTLTAAGLTPAADFAHLAGLALEARHVEPGEKVTMVVTDPVYGYGILLKAENYVTYNSDSSSADFGKQTLTNWITAYPDLAAELILHGYKFLTGLRPAQS